MHTDPANNITLLTADQVETLRHVFDRKNSKQIARLMDVSPHTVDERVRKTLKKLNVSNRMEAALVLARHGIFDDVTPVQPWAYQPFNFRDAPISGDVDAGRSALRQSFDIGLPFSTVPQPENRHGLLERIVWSILIAIAVILAFSALYMILVGSGHRLT